MDPKKGVEDVNEETLVGPDGELFRPVEEPAEANDDRADDLGDDDEYDDYVPGIV